MCCGSVRCGYLNWVVFIGLVISKMVTNENLVDDIFSVLNDCSASADDQIEEVIRLLRSNGNIP